MATKDDGGPAFPVPDLGNQHGGMKLRDWYAGLAMQAIVTATYREMVSKPHELHVAFEQTVAECAFAQADAMIEARKQ